MEIKSFYFNDLRTCCYILWDHTNECIIVDPGCYTQSEEKRLAQFIEDHGLTPKLIANTHCHFDHIMGLEFMLKTYHIPFLAHKLEESNLKRAEAYSSFFGLNIPQPDAFITPIDHLDVIRFGESEIQVFHTPGHSPGGLCLYIPSRNWLLSGDTLFAGSIGRTDLPGGNYDQLSESLERIIKPLPQETVVYPGHGPSTTLTEEWHQNPYLQHL